MYAYTILSYLLMANNNTRDCRSTSRPVLSHPWTDKSTDKQKCTENNLEERMNLSILLIHSGLKSRPLAGKLFVLVEIMCGLQLSLLGWNHWQHH